MRYGVYIFAITVISCVTRTALNPQQVKKNERRAATTKCLNALLADTTGSADRISTGTAIYLAPSGKSDYVYSPYSTYKIEDSFEQMKYCIHLPTDHSIWKIDKTATDDRVVNDDTCSSFLRLTEIKKYTKKADNLISQDVKNRITQLNALEKQELKDKSDEEAKDIKANYDQKRLACEDFIKGNS